jgi:hypothetical protein
VLEELEVQQVGLGGTQLVDEVLVANLHAQLPRQVGEHTAELLALGELRAELLEQRRRHLLQQHLRARGE